MTNGEVKLLSNMFFLLPFVENKNTYLEDDYSIVYKLIDGYKNIEKYFHNNTIINDILDKKYNDIKLFDLIRIVRNRASHIDKNNNIDKFIILQTKVDKKEIDSLINEIKKEMFIIYERDLNSDAYKFVMNTKPMIYIFELAKSKINDIDYKNDFDKDSREILKPLVNNFNYDNSTLEDYGEYVNQIIKIYESDLFKKGIIKLYGVSIYNDILRMIEDETFSFDDMKSLINKIKKIDDKKVHIDM